MIQIDDMPRTACGRRILGRRPHYVRWAPSKPLPWHFGVWVDGHRFTVEQEEALAAREIDPATAETIEVRREWDPYADDCGELRINDLWPVYVFDCPVIARLGGVVQVLAPNGKPRDVLPSGWAKAPHKNPYYGQ